MEDDAMFLVQGADEVTDFGTEYALERPRVRGVQLGWSPLTRGRSSAYSVGKS